MKKLIFMCMFALLLIIQTPVVSVAESTTNAGLVNPSLVNSLRQGGYILYVRHGEATIGEDQPNLIFSDCATQRNLTEEGKRQASLYGQKLRVLQIPVLTPVSASPFCRTRETAELAFGAGNVQVDSFWTKVYNLSGNVTTEERENTLATLTTILEKEPPTGLNKVIIAHSFPSGTGLGEIPFLGTVILKPKGQGNGYDIVDRLSFNELSSLQ
ncbi:histidine phosphatase family protein [Paenibacillus sp. Marseille-Q4541]|uniref:histidine phosphatase family protein n=1 Tax=Paenibacillus sp. Marseille-Q4541 TaxID=2831522 RepID=UPI001BA7C219|nr:histidine phosphatase family protein [Paenibacillus sp. Marseille-Q4541]